MQTPPKFLVYLPQLCPHALLHWSSQHGELSTGMGLRATMREAQEVEGLRLAQAASCSAFFRISSELDHTRLVGMQFQVEPAESLPQVLQ
jgi:hypothetical protein